MADDRAISGVPTSITAFVGRTRTGPTDRPQLVRNRTEFEDQFGGPWAESPLGYSVRHYFDNGGREALICRIGSGDDDPPLTDADVSDPGHEAERRGLWMLDHADQFNVLVIPPLGPGRDVGRETWDAAAGYAARRRAIVLVDPPATWTRATDVTDADLAAIVTPGPSLANAALYVPRIRAPDPLAGSVPATFAPSGAVAGVFARTDAQRGVWKAPAGIGAGLIGITDLAEHLTDGDQDGLNPRGINAIRSFPGQGIVVWGSRTLAGADVAASEWKYVPVRRTALFIEESIDRGTRWATSEPNGEPLWAEIRRHVEAFLFDLWRTGAFPAPTPREAFFVKCDRTTMTQADIDAGRITIEIGVALIQPAEFVMLRIGQLVGGASTAS